MVEVSTVVKFGCGCVDPVPIVSPCFPEFPAEEEVVH